MMHYCAECKLAVIVTPEKIIKPCHCKAAIIGEMSATCKGSGLFAV